jgi:LCP family protein required for cell wall assembly
MSNASSTVRYPDVNSADVMTKRAWCLVGLNILIPGSAQVLAGSRKLGRFGVGATFSLWALAIIALLAFSFAQGAFITVATNFFVLWIVQAAIVFYIVLWVVLTLDTLRLIKLVKVGEGSRAFVAGLAVVVLVGVGGTAAYGVMIAGVTRSTLGEVFAGGTIEPPIDGRYNFLLLGGDAGSDRDGLRPDSISVASVDAATGQAVMIGVPRDIEYALFPPDSPMAALYPNGYGYDGCEVDVCLLNSIYTEVELYHADLYPDAVAAGSSPGIEATKEAVEGTLGISIQYYVLVDMFGFAQLIDALGGIVIDSPQRYPITDEVDENGDPYGEVPWIEAGVQTMDGYTALSYARIRVGTTDYDRMVRQRQVQGAVIEQFDPANVLGKFQAIAEAGQQVVKTNIPQGMLGPFVELAGKTRLLPIESVELVPPLVDPQYPDFAYIHQLVSEALFIATPEPEPGG